MVGLFGAGGRVAASAWSKTGCFFRADVCGAAGAALLEAAPGRRDGRRDGRARRGARRFMAMMWRLNFLVAVTCVALQNSYMLYYICPMHTLFTIMVYAALGIGARYNQSHTGVLLKCARALALRGRVG
jgi:hypothetical protein